MSIFNQFLQKTDGSTAIEYGLLAAFMAVVVVGAIAVLQGPINGLFAYIMEQFAAINQG